MKACFTGVTTGVESGFSGVVTSIIDLPVVGTLSESRVCEADSLLLLEGDGATGASGGKNRGGAETPAWTRGSRVSSCWA